jgi:hypothetical protein
LSVANGVPLLVPLLVVQVELMLGCMLLFHVAPRLTLKFKAILFSAFACISASRALAGLESCGCFGPVRVHPWHTALLDVGIVAASVILARRAPHGDGSRRQWRRALAAYAALGVVTTVWIVNSDVGYVGDSQAGLHAADGLVIVDPGKWGDGSFPLTDYLEPAYDLTEGDWTVLLFHHDCPDCQAALPRYESLAAELRLAGSAERVLLIEVPPCGEPLKEPRSAHYARLVERRQWFVQAPVEVLVRGGKVVSVSRELTATIK